MEQPEAGLTYQGKPRTCGLRFSVTDGVVLVVAALLTLGTYSITAGFSLLILFVVLHFFLFCNVFRVRRKPELIWAGTFLLNCAGWLLAGQLNIRGMMGGQLVITVLIIASELRKPYYHGIFARRINPHIDEYLAGRY